MKISEKDKQIAFALLVLTAALVALYAIFFFEPYQKETNLEEFLQKAYASEKIALFLDARGTDEETARKIYQCATDLASGKFVGTKTVETYGCDDSQCIYMGSGGTKHLTYEQVRQSLRDLLYIRVSAGAPSTKAFENRLEIKLDSNYSGGCKIG
ncbi:MAG: hypothetical protein QXN37_03955 [Candidatus Anstonellaceae archaeon]